MQKNLKKKEYIVVVGMGFVGLTLGLTLANNGHNVIGIECNEKSFENLKQGKPHFYEKNLKHLLLKNLQKKKILFFKDFSELKDFNITYFIIAVGTPIDKKKKIHLKTIFEISNKIYKIIQKKTIIILRSTVKIGTTRKIEKIFRLKKNIVNFAFCPERTIEGDALNELKYLPQIIGCENKSAKKRINKLFLSITKYCVNLDTYEQAEIVKLIDNSFRDSIFSFSNQIAKIGELMGININESLIKANFKYPRNTLPRAGLVGGPCLTKDPYILMQSLKNKIELPIIKESRLNNDSIPSFTINLLKKKIKKNIKKALICGLTFKGVPENDDIRNSLSLNVIKELRINYKNIAIDTLDPCIKEKSFNFSTGKHFQKFNQIKYKYDLLIIANNNKYWKKISYNKMSLKIKSEGLIYDYWNTFENINKKNYIVYGSGKLVQK